MQVEAFAQSRVQTYIVEYEHELDSTKRYAKLEVVGTKTWRELQVIFDPRYHYNNLVFLHIDSQLRHKPGD